jgi:hypothetical protein
VRVLPNRRAVGGGQALQAAPQAPASQVQTLLQLFHAGTYINTIFVGKLFQIKNTVKMLVIRWNFFVQMLFKMMLHFVS